MRLDQTIHVLLLFVASERVRLVFLHSAWCSCSADANLGVLMYIRDENRLGGVGSPPNAAVSHPIIAVFLYLTSPGWARALMRGPLFLIHSRLTFEGAC